MPSSVHVDGRCEFGLCLFLSLPSEVLCMGTSHVWNSKDITMDSVLELATVIRCSVLLVYP